MTETINDLGADSYATQYLDNLCKGPYNMDDYDHFQALTMLDLFDIIDDRSSSGARNKRSYAYNKDSVFQTPNTFKRRRKKHHRMRGQEAYDLGKPARRNDRNSFKPIKTHAGSFPDDKKISDAIGMALLGSTCDKRMHCTLVEMNSFSPSISAAHELAHSMGMNHEGANGCPPNESPSSFAIPTHEMKIGWTQFAQLPILSTCAIRELVAFLRGTGRCLVKKAPLIGDGSELRKLLKSSKSTHALSLRDRPVHSYSSRSLAAKLASF